MELSDIYPEMYLALIFGQSIKQAKLHPV